MTPIRAIENTAPALPIDTTLEPDDSPVEPSSHYQAAAPAKTPLQSVEKRRAAGAQQVVPGQEGHPALKALFADAKTPQPRFEANDLYDASGLPSSSDIQQNSIGDCYYVATLGAVADQQPERIQNAIQYHPETGNFTVTLYGAFDKDGVMRDHGRVEKREFEVTQSEILDNLHRKGGSTVDNRAGIDGPIWPAVMEIAYAKAHDDNPADGLNNGYSKINGGHAPNAMLAITGDEGRSFKISSSRGKSLDRAHDVIKQALAEKKPIVLGTVPEKKEGLHDGLVNQHEYIVKDIYRNRAGEIMIRVRNPWAHNNRRDEATSIQNAEFAIQLKDLVDAGGLGAIQIGIGPKD